MDEPTASLSQNETETLIDIIRKLKQRNIGIVYITHRLDEIFAIADRVTVLRDGRTIDSLPIAEVTREVLVRKMVDRELSQLYGEYHSHSTDKVMMSVRGLRLKQVAAHTAKVADISFDLHQGEILGVFGLMGAGRTEIMETIFGVRAYEGEIRMDGKLLQIHDPASAMAHGIGFVTEDRKAQGLVLGMKVRENFESDASREVLPVGVCQPIPRRRALPRVCPLAGDQNPFDRAAGGEPEWRQPTEGGDRQMGSPAPSCPDRGRADSWDRCRR